MGKELCQDEYDLGKNDFLSGLVEFTNFVKSTPVESRLLQPLIVIVNTEIKTNNPIYQHTIAWKFIGHLIRNDDALWPDGVPMDPNHHKWAMCFNGVQLFLNISSPSHQLLKNRNLGPSLVLIINPRENFDVVANANERSGQLVRAKIRERVQKYNDGILPPELGFYGDEENLEWKQYHLSESSLERPEICPLLDVINE